MRRSDVILVCSRSEGFGRVTIEGMLARKPVIGARCGATAELIQDGTTGLLYNYGDPSDLADRIQHLYHNRAAAEQLGKNAELFVRRVFTRERYIAELLPVLTSLINPGNSRR
jgi:glycosyltransferase involved in cell wall biosynthesis